MYKNILIIGKKGQLSLEFQSLLKDAEVVSYTGDFPIKKDFQKFLQNSNYKVIINCTAYTAVDKAENEKDLCWELNVELPKILSEICAEKQIFLINFSTDYVFDGTSKVPYQPTDITNPLNWYGLTKSFGEKIQINYLPESVIIRTSWLYSSHGNNFVKTIFKKLVNGESLKIIDDQFGSPTSAKNLAYAVKQHFLDSDKLQRGIHHFSDLASVSWFDFANQISASMIKIGLMSNNCEINSQKTICINQAAKRPKYSIIGNTITQDIDWIKNLEEVLICISK